MSGTTVDWMATAAWVQAIGSIAAIIAAIWIVDKQHRQNVELVKAERLRLHQEEIERRRKEGADLRAITDIVFGGMLADLGSTLEALRVHEGRHTALHPDDFAKLVGMRHHVAHVKGQMEGLRDAFTKTPGDLLVHMHLISSLKVLDQRCLEECDNDRARAAQDDGPPVLYSPVSFAGIREAIEVSRNVLASVGIY